MRSNGLKEAAEARRGDELKEAAEARRAAEDKPADGVELQIHVAQDSAPVWKQQVGVDGAAGKGECSLARRKRAPTHISIDELYDKNAFSNPFGGAWTQGWDVQYSANEWSSSAPLKIFVVPHSHNDPGESTRRMGSRGAAFLTRILALHRLD